MLHVVIFCVVKVDAVGSGLSDVRPLFVVREITRCNEPLELCARLSLFAAVEPAQKCEQQTSYLGKVASLHGLKDMLTRVGIMNEGVTLRTMNDLKMLCARLAEDGLWRHRVQREGE